MSSSFDLERLLAESPPKRVLGLAVRAAARLVPILAASVETAGPEALEWMNAAHCGAAILKRFASGERVSRFLLGAVADVLRGAANANAQVMRQMGPSKETEWAEYALAAVAMAADAARSIGTPKFGTTIGQAVRAVRHVGLVPEELLGTDAAVVATDAWPDLWPEGSEPSWSRDGWERYLRGGPFPALFGERGTSATVVAKS